MKRVLEVTLSCSRTFYYLGKNKGVERYCWLDGGSSNGKFHHEVSFGDTFDMYLEACHH